jgi:hypothetical protein
MGNPHVFYKRALQNFAHCLAAEDNNFSLARKLYEEESDEVLEDFILKKKNEINAKLFFYDAGQTCQVVMQEADEEGCDALNASCGGLTEFEYFIGIREDDDC